MKYGMTESSKSTVYGGKGKMDSAPRNPALIIQSPLRSRKEERVTFEALELPLASVTKPYCGQLSNS